MQDGNNKKVDESFLKYLVTAEELATLLKVPLSWVYDHTRKSGPGKLPYYMVDRCLRFSVPEIEDYLKIYG